MTRYIDRSRITTDWDCRRKRYLQYELGGRGIVPATTSLELWLGTTVHDGLARIADAFQAEQTAGPRGSTFSIDINSIASTAGASLRNSLLPPGEIPDPDTRAFAAEQGALVEGLLRGFYRQVWPRMMQQFPRIIAVEEELTYTLRPCSVSGCGHSDPRTCNSIIFMAKPDLLVEDAEGGVWYIEYKTTSSKKQSWIDSWSTAVQLHSSIKAVEETLKREVTGVIVQGLYKGYESYGRQNSPFCYGFVRSGNPPFTADSVRYDYAAGYRRLPVWEMQGGVQRWVERMPDEILTDQFPQVPPIFVKDELVERFFNQTKLRESQIEMGVKDILCEHATDDIIETVLDEVFPQSFDQCVPSFGRSCSYKRICHGQVDRPLEQGYILREAHHAPEEELHRDQV